MLSVLSITAPRPVVDFYSTRRGVERPVDDAMVPSDRVSLSPEARRQLRAVEEVEQGHGERAEDGTDESETSEAALAKKSAKASGGKDGADAPGQLRGKGTKLTPEQQQQVSELQRRDAHVRQHEAAHQAAGGDLTGSATFSYQVGPDGKNYAVGGEVPLQSRTGRTPDETIAIARRVRAAALAPSDPSPADLSAAAQATQLELRASQQKRAQGSGEKKGAKGAEAGQPAMPSPRADLERLIVRAPEPQPFL